MLRIYSAKNWKFLFHRMSGLILLIYLNSLLNYLNHLNYLFHFVIDILFLLQMYRYLIKYLVYHIHS